MIESARDDDLHQHILGGNQRYLLRTAMGRTAFRAAVGGDDVEVRRLTEFALQHIGQTTMQPIQGRITGLVLEQQDGDGALPRRRDLQHAGIGLLTAVHRCIRGSQADLAPIIALATANKE